MSTVCDTLVSGFTTLAAAFAGAWFAYKLNGAREARSTTQKRAEAGNGATFALARQYNILASIQAQSIDPVRNDEARFLKMVPVLSVNTELPLVNLGSLEFLLSTEHRQTLMRVGIAQERFHTAMRALDERSRVHHDEVQVALQIAGFKEGQKVTAEQLESMLGQRLLKHIIRSTNAVIVSVDDALKSTLDASNELHGALKAALPDHAFISIEAGEAAEPALAADGAARRS